MTPDFRCPASLGPALDHAESFCALLGRLEARRSAGLARTWLMGRRQEIACFVRQIARDLRSKRLGDDAAVCAIEQYLAMLHEGAAAHFGERAPECCRASGLARPVVSRLADCTPTAFYVRGPRANLAASATWIDVQAEELVGGVRRW